MGKFTIAAVTLNTDGDNLTFVSTEGVELRLQLVGDCCSHSYFDKDAELDVSALLGSTLTNIEYSFVSSADDADGYGEIKTYALLLRTDKWSTSLMWHNSSNGYYCGGVELYINGDQWCSYDRRDTRMQDLGIAYMES